MQFKVPLRELRGFELIQEGLGYREWVIPADLIAKHATVKMSAA